MEAADAASAQLNNRRPDRGAAESLAKVVEAWSTSATRPPRRPRPICGDWIAWWPPDIIRQRWRGRSRLASLQNLPTGEARAEAVRQAADRKYPAAGGRIGREEFKQEVLDRLKAAGPAPAVTP